MGYFGGKKGYKGYDVLIDAARLLQNSSVNFELRLYGDSYGDTGIACALSCGKVNPNEIIDVLRQLDLVIVPSIYEETFGFVVLELYALGFESFVLMRLEPVSCSIAIRCLIAVIPKLLLI